MAVCFFSTKTTGLYWMPLRALWKRWAPIAATMPEDARWSPAERRALGDVVRAKGARRETAFVEKFAMHPKLAKVLFGAA